jgi:hypothetical protein
VDTVDQTKLTFVNVVGNVLVTVNFNLTISGTLTFNIIEQHSLLYFGGQGTLSLGELTLPCLRNPDLCQFGFTITFRIK